MKVIQIRSSEKEEKMKKIIVLVMVFCCVFSASADAKVVNVGLAENTRYEMVSNTWRPTTLSVRAFDRKRGIVPNVLIRADVVVTKGNGDLGHLHQEIVKTDETGLAEFIYRPPAFNGVVDVYFTVDSQDYFNVNGSGVVVSISFINFFASTRSSIGLSGFFGRESSNFLPVFYVRENSSRELKILVVLGAGILPEEEPVFSSMWEGPMYCANNNILLFPVKGGVAGDKVEHHLWLTGGYPLKFIVETVE